MAPLTTRHHPVLERLWLEQIQREVGAKPIRPHLSPNVLSLSQRMETAQPQKPFKKEAHTSFRSSAKHKHKGTLEMNRDTHSKKGTKCTHNDKIEEKDTNRPAPSTKTCQASFSPLFPLTTSLSPQLSQRVHGERRHSMQRQQLNKKASPVLELLWLEQIEAHR